MGGTILIAKQGDTLDALLWRDASLSVDCIGPVLAANPGIADLGTILPLGTRITVPSSVITITNKRERTLINLWD